MNARAMGIPKLPRYTEEEREGMYERQKERVRLGKKESGQERREKLALRKYERFN